MKKLLSFCGQMQTRPLNQHTFAVFMYCAVTFDYLLNGNMKIVWVSGPETQTRNPGLALDSNPKPGFTIWRVFAISTPECLSHRRLWLSFPTFLKRRKCNPRYKDLYYDFEFQQAMCLTWFVCEAYTSLALLSRV